jgi:hypothetical protein
MNGWQPQFYGIAAAQNAQILSKILRDKYSPTDQAPRPVHIKECDGSLLAISYAFKTNFIRRIAYKDPQGRWNTRKVYLPPKQHVQAMLWMNQTAVGNRLFLKNVRMTRVGQHVGLVQIKKLE